MLTLRPDETESSKVYVLGGSQGRSSQDRERERRKGMDKGVIMEIFLYFWVGKDMGKSH
jgi:hypothetical protein